MAFIQCSLTGTALSWYICSNDTYKQDWHAFVQAFKNNSLLKRMLTMLKLKPLIYQKRTIKSYVILHLKFNNSWLKTAGVMRMHLLSISNVMKFLQKDFLKSSKTLQINDK